ncbi:Uncharacterized protein BP5553_07075 [Venustampulla echinocandica]|uniref:NAD(P)-binding protein n=1 Tax=Venustampulla echinocandica TaxID=2656787 RepID=A0A370TIF9_9HELO|nr:Uncharacterized protein BP5553_07075 [Venustampulla echinocandica]RDL35144.1 Uncharacterized protein BP5553_07075 [Venustampulla echinocandica]
MVNIKDVRISNSELKQSQSASGLVAVFVGATNGIGMGTLKQFTKLANAPKVYVVGRSRKASTLLLNELEASNPQATVVFFETEVSLMKNVDQICDEIKVKEKKLDILFLSCGYLTWDGRTETIEGIDIPHALRYYTRLRFTYNLLPLLTASPSPRVISILAGGREAEIDLTDLEVRNNFSGIKAMKNGTTQTTLAFEELVKSYPSITFIHKYPGFVDTGVVDRLMGTTKGIYALPATAFRWLLLPIINLFATSVDEAGERGLFLATSARYPSAKPKAEGGLWVPVPKGVDVATSAVEGVYRVGADDATVKDTPALIAYRKENAGKTVWENTLAVWERALGRSG